MSINLQSVVMTATIAGIVSLSSGVLAEDHPGDVSSTDGIEHVVIALKTNPIRDPEAACVALQIGMNLLMNDVNGPADGGDVHPADRVTLFPTLDGVEIVSDRMAMRGTLPNGKPKPYPAHLYCTTPGGEVPLPELVYGFAQMNNAAILVCPLCWNARYEGEDPIYGSVGNGVTIHNLFLYADKVIDF